MASLPRQGHTCHLNPDNGGTPGTASVMSVLCHAWKLKDDPEPIPHEGYLIMKKGRTTTGMTTNTHSQKGASVDS